MFVKKKKTVVTTAQRPRRPRPWHVAARQRGVAADQALQLGEGHHGPGDLGRGAFFVEENR